MGDLAKRLSSVPSSTNFEDRTGWTSHDHGMQAVKNLLNPVTAYRNTRGLLLRRGVISPPRRNLRLGLPKVEDR